MRIGTKVATMVLGSGLALMGMAIPANAQLATGSTATTFVLTQGLLTMTTPAAAVLTPASAGATTASGSLGLQTVADLRGALNNGWTDTVSSTTFTTGTSTANETVALGNIAYASGAGTVTANGSFTAGSGALSAPLSGGTHTAGTGISTTTWTPSLTLTLLGSQAAGTYAGTITHSVA